MLYNHQMIQSLQDLVYFVILSILYMGPFVNLINHDMEIHDHHSFIFLMINVYLMLYDLLIIIYITIIMVNLLFNQEVQKIVLHDYHLNLHNISYSFICRLGMLYFLKTLYRFQIIGDLLMFFGRLISLMIIYYFLLFYSCFYS